jgi:(1->4)-alpha-D-glucan 1-alpha-D-glucosylmutase
MAAMLIAPRLVFGVFYQGVMPSSERWAETAIVLPEELGGLRYRDLFTGQTFEPAGHLSISRAFADYPFALLISD